MKWLNCTKIRLVLVVFVAAIVIGGGGSAYADFTFGEPTNLGPTINSPHSDAPGSFSSDGLEMYFDSNRSGGSWDTYDIYVSRRTTTDDAWGTPVKLGPSVNSSRSDFGSIISTDGLSLYFTSLFRAGGYGVLDIWVTMRQTIDDDWGESSNLGPTINTSQDDIAKSISCDGLVLYFQRKPPPNGPGDLYMSRRPTTNDAWGEPVNLGPTVNSSYSDGSPFTSANGLLLFFFSNRPGGFGDRDLYMTRRATIDDDWGIPVNLGPTINTSALDAFATILPDGSTLLFASSRPGGVGGWDIWQAPILPVVDFNGEGIVDAADMCIMVDHWGTDELLCDIGPTPFGDGIVDVQDLIALSEHLFTNPGAVAYWKLDETEGDVAYDSAAENDAVVLGNAAWAPNDGMIDGALQFDGIDDYLATDPVLNPADRAFSVVAWVVGGAPGQVILSQADGASWLLADPLGGRLMTNLSQPPGGRKTPPPLVSEFVITDGNWHRIAFVWDGLHRALYVDDMLVAEDTQSGLSSSVGGLNIGCGSDSAAGTFWSGLIDDVRVYNRAVSP